MATRKKKDVAVVDQQAGTSIATIDAELNTSIAALQSAINAPSGNRIKAEVRGEFTLPGGMNLGNEIQVVVLDFLNRNMFYATKFNPDNPSPPDCYSLGVAIADLAPESDSPSAQNDNCKTCPMNAFGTGDNGRGKACQNRIWVSVLLIDPDSPQAHLEPDAPVYMIDLSPSNRKSFEAYVAATARTVGHPIKTIATVTAANAGTYATVSFAAPIPNPDYAACAARRKEASEMLQRRPDFAAYAARAAAPSQVRGKARAPAKGAAPAKAGRR